MKKILLTILTVLIALTTTAQQQGINYKALMKDASGNVLSSVPVSVQFIISDANTNIVYQESHTDNTDANGIIILNIGEGTTADIFTDINWASDDHFLNVQVNTGSGLVDMGTTQFMAVPYAKHANTAITAETATTALNAGATSINGLTDGKSDSNGSSLFLGVDAGLNDDQTDNRNVGIGFQTLTVNTTGENNTANGYQVLYSNTTGFSNTANGYQALYSNTTGSNNVANGSEALFSNTAGNFNTANGSGSLYSNTTGYSNTANGSEALYSNTTGYENTANGIGALSSNTTGTSNIAIGVSALSGNTTGHLNIAIGTAALFLNNGSGNIALGSQAGLYETGSDKLYIDNSSTTSPLIYGDFGTDELTINGDLEVTGSNNLTSGLEAINEGNGTGWRLKGQNPVNYGNIGLKAIDFSTNEISSTIHGATGTNSTAMGTVTTASGNYSTAMGYNTTASGVVSTAMGNSTQAKGNYTTAMGLYNYDLAGQERLFIVGNGTSSSTRSNAFTVYQGTDADLTTFNSGYVMIGNNSTANLLFDTNEIMARNNGVAANLHLQGNGGNVYVNGAIVHTSDKRLKNDITPLTYGLKDILKLNPVAYNWKHKPNRKYKSLGLIAQELQEVVSNVVYEDEDTQKTLHVNYTELIPVLINAIKEQQEIIKSQQLSVNSLQSTVSSQKEDFSALLQRIEQLEKNNQIIVKSE